MSLLLEQAQILKSYYNLNGIMPTYREICILMGWKSSTAAFKFGERMIKKGYLKKVGRRLAPTDKFNEL